MHLVPSFEPTLPLSAIQEVYQDLRDISGANKRELAQGVCCLLCYATNFVPANGDAQPKFADGHSLAKVKAMSPDDAAKELANQLATHCPECADDSSPPKRQAKAFASKADAVRLPWATIIALALKILEGLL
jgi:hypothetical protein